MDLLKAPWLRNTVTFIVAFYVVGLLALFLLQRSFMYFPDTRRIDPAAVSTIGPPPTEVVLNTPDGERVIGWWYPPKDGNPTIVHFHGNGGGLAIRVPRYEFYASQGYGVLAMSYRGYSGSTGAPSETHLIADAPLALDWLAAQNIPSGNVVLYGESLGTGVAVQTAARFDIKAVVLESPYTSTRAVAQTRFPIFPIGLLMKDQFESDQHIAGINAPLLIVHGRRDRIIPFRFGKALFDLAAEPKTFIPIENGGHIPLYADRSARLVVEFLAELDDLR